MTPDEMRAAIRHFQGMLGELPEARITVGEVVTRYMESLSFQSLSQKWAEEIRFRLHIVPKLGRLMVAELNAAKLDEYRAERKREPGVGGHLTRPGTRNREVKRLMAAMSWAASARGGKLIGENPIREAPMEDEDNLRQTCPTVEQVQAIIDKGRRIRFRAMVATKFFSGLRVSELLALCLSQIAWDEGLIVLQARQAKGKKRARITILPEMASGLVREYLDQRPLESELLFCTESGGRISRRNFLRDFQRVAEAAGVAGAEGETLCLHDLRSGFVGHQLELRTPQEVIKAMLGHSTDSAFRRYVRVQRRWLIDAREQAELAELKAAKRRGPKGTRSLSRDDDDESSADEKVLDG